MLEKFHGILTQNGRNAPQRHGDHPPGPWHHPMCQRSQWPHHERLQNDAPTAQANLDGGGSRRVRGCGTV
ncbi:hypothetical protein CyaNS01_00416 [Cyanobium sp. NS01]|nr:hypothetical protein CyaNS01_00416 [Cyanobium sp. NS01]